MLSGKTMLFGKKKRVVDEGKALIEMYKAGFLDGYKIKKNLRSKKSFVILNKFYKKAFNKRFGKQITKKLLKKR